MKVLVIGANGNTGRRVTRILARSSDHDPVAMIRDPSQRPHFDRLGVPTVLAELECPIDHAFCAHGGADAVIFAAGSGSTTGKDKTVLIDHIGAIRAAITAQVHGARRFVMLSAVNADVNSQSSIKHYHRAKGHADNFLRSASEVFDVSLDYTIICPGGLTNDTGTGLVTIKKEIEGSGLTSRENLAAALVECLKLENAHGKSFSLFEGETPLSEALRAI